MDSVTQSSSESSKSPEPSQMPTSSDPTTVVPQMTRKIKTYGSLATEKLSHVKSFIKKTIKEEKADRLSRKELDKVAIAKMRLGADEYDEMLDVMQKECDLNRPKAEDWRVEGECDGNGDGEVVGVSREELDIISLRRQLANMRKRS